MNREAHENFIGVQGKSGFQVNKQYYALYKHFLEGGAVGPPEKFLPFYTQVIAF